MTKESIRVKYGKDGWVSSGGEASLSRCFSAEVVSASEISVGSISLG